MKIIVQVVKENLKKLVFVGFLLLPMLRQSGVCFFLTNGETCIQYDYTRKNVPYRVWYHGSVYAMYAGLILFKPALMANLCNVNHIRS